MSDNISPCNQALLTEARNLIASYEEVPGPFTSAKVSAVIFLIANVLRVSLRDATNMIREEIQPISAPAVGVNDSGPIRNSRDVIIRDIKLGQTLPDIAEHYGVSVDLLRQIVLEEGLVQEMTAGAFHRRRRQRVLDSFSSGNSIEKIAEQTNMPVENIRRILEEEGVNLTVVGGRRARQAAKNVELQRLVLLVTRQHKLGMTIKEIAEHYQIPESTVRQILVDECLIEGNVPLAPAVSADDRPSQAQVQVSRMRIIAEHIAKGQTYEWIANEYSIDYDVVNKISEVLAEL